MEFVDHDPLAAGRAAAECRDAARDCLAVASLLDGGVGDRLAAWVGDSRLGFDDVAAQVADDLRAEAGRLEGTADDIDRATRRAWDADGRRRHEHLERARRRGEQQGDRCTPTGGV